METITSRTNPLMTHIRKLSSSGAYRRSHGEFLCDSPKLLREALLWKAELLTVVCTDPAELPLLPDGVRCVVIPQDVMTSVSPMKTPQGVLFTCRLPEKDLPDQLCGRHYIVLDSVQDPGNVGTIWRTADAFDCDGVLLLPGCADPYSHKTIRASMGAVFRCPVWQMEPSELKNLLLRSQIPLYGAALRSDTLDVRAVDYSHAAIAIGSEGRGLTEEMLNLCDQTIRIPMSERCESLNAAIAASVLLWECYRGQ